MKISVEYLNVVRPAHKLFSQQTGSCDRRDKTVCLHQAEGADALICSFILIVAHMASQDKKTTWHFDLGCAAHIIRNIEKYSMIMNNVY